jgi:hypothetical protein
MKQLKIGFTNILSSLQLHAPHNLQSPPVSNRPESAQCFPAVNDDNAPSGSLKGQHILHRLFQNLIVLLFVTAMPQFIDAEMKNDTTAY